MTGLSLVGRRLYLCTPDRPDLASFLAACIDGGVDVVQLRDKFLEARALLPRARLAAQVCGDRGVPFVLNDRPDLALEVGPVNPTPTKPGRPGTGLEYLAYAASHALLPWFVTGGVTPDTVPAMVAAGARRFVVVRWLTEAADPRAAAAAVAAAIDEAVVR